MNLELRRKVPDFLNLDWEKVYEELKACNPNSGEFYIITVNKGQSDEYRTRFLTHHEALELVFSAVQKKKIRVSTLTT